MINVKMLETYISKGFNILLEGKHGVGKTTALAEACNNLGLKWEYLPASTLDPYIDFVGIPDIERTEDGKHIDMVRKRNIREADVLFFEEINRAGDTKTTNGIMEVIQFGTINGEALPNLKCVIAAMNPVDEAYNTESLDEALVDRFHVFMEVKPELSKKYLETKLKPETVEALIKWYKARGQKADYISPRRAEYLGLTWETFGDKETLKAAMPPGGTYDTGKLFNMLSTENYSEDLDSILTLDGTDDLSAFIRSAGCDRLVNSFKDQNENTVDQALKAIATAMKGQFGPVTLKSYLPLLDLMKGDHIKTLTEDWTASKKKEMMGWEDLRDYKSENGGLALFREAVEG